MCNAPCLSFAALAGGTATPPRPSPPVSSWMSQLQNLAHSYIYLHIQTVQSHNTQLAFLHFRLLHPRTKLKPCLTCIWNIGPYTCFLFPCFDTTQLKNFQLSRAKEKKYHAPLRYRLSSFISANTTFKLVETHARKIKECKMYGSKVNTHIKKTASMKCYNFLNSVILPGTLYNGSQNSAEVLCSLEA
jgi:hypothetical protein